MTTNRPLRVFLCHSSNDKPAVRELYNTLKSQDWVDPWLDKMKILPGQNWRIVIEEAVEASDIIIICISNHSVTKEGFVQREIRYAYDLALEKPDSVIFLIPLRLENCEVPRGMRSFQWVDYFGFEKEEQYSNLLESLKLRHKQKLQLEEKEHNLSNIQEEKPPEKKQNDMGWMDDYHSKHAKPLEEYKTDKIALSNGMEFMHVPAGKFWMGSDDFGENEKPLHLVDAPYNYWVARYLVTNKNYNEFRKISFQEERQNHPFIAMYYEAQDYIRWLNGELQKFLPHGYLFSLPSESEWEKAARGTDDKLIYPWGQSFDTLKCNSKESGINDTTPVGSYSPFGDSPFGCADMVGNVWEWTRSQMQKYPYDSIDGREDDHQDASGRVVRGGSYKNVSETVRCAKRFRRQPKYKYANVGFRLVLIPSLPK